MLDKTRGIVLRSVKFGDSSLVVTMFTEAHGVQSYLLKGIRNPKSGQQKTGLLQPGSLLDLVIYHNPQKNLQHLREFQVASYFQSLREDVIKNSISIFSIEVLLRILPEQAPHPALFAFAFNYLNTLDAAPIAASANYPVFFLINVGRSLGYELHGSYSLATPYPNPETGCFTALPAVLPVTLTRDDMAAMAAINSAVDVGALSCINLNSATRLRLIDWYLSFLQYHTQHMSAIRSLPILQSVLHAD